MAHLVQSFQYVFFLRPPRRPEDWEAATHENTTMTRHESSSADAKAPKTVVIPDLHRVASAL